MEIVKHLSTLLAKTSKMKRLSVSLIGGIFGLSLPFIIMVLSALKMGLIAKTIYYICWIITGPSSILTNFLISVIYYENYITVFFIMFISHFVVGCVLGFLISVISRRIMNSKME